MADNWDESDPLNYCLCGEPYISEDPVGGMILCTRCAQWLHWRCCQNIDDIGHFILLSGNGTPYKCPQCDVSIILVYSANLCIESGFNLPESPGRGKFLYQSSNILPDLTWIFTSVESRTTG